MGKKRVLQILVLCIILAAIVGIYLIKNPPLFTFAFAVVMGLILDKAGFEKEIKNVSVKGGHQDGVCWEKLQGTFWQKQWQAVKVSLKEAFTLFRSVVLFLLLGSGIGAFIYEFVPTDLLGSIFKKKMVIAFVLCIFAVAVVTGYVFNLIL